MEIGTSSYGGLAGKTGKAHTPRAYVWKKVLGRVSLHIGALLGDLGRGVRLLGTLRYG
jgi:hypothetical protein